ncbi:MAG: rhomboid family intramembrane serine protease, partial [Candidatus Thermochlorobacter sp.]
MSDSIDNSNSSDATDSSQPLKWNEILIMVPFFSGSLLICCLVFIVMAIYDQSLFSFSNVALIDFGAAFNISIYEGQYWRLLTSTFIHANLLHLFLNMLALFLFGFATELLYKKTDYFLILLVSALISSSASFYSHSDAFSISVGFSGVLLGILAAFIMFGLFSGEPELRKAVLNWQFLLSVLAIIVGDTDKNTDIVAHFYGFLSGVILTGPYWYLNNILQKPSLASTTFYITAFVLIFSGAVIVKNTPTDIYRYYLQLTDIETHYDAISDPAILYNDTTKTWEEKQQLAQEQI